jgi:uncharacterized protein YdaU (DUF1376 family)
MEDNTIVSIVAIGAGALVAIVGAYIAAKKQRDLAREERLQDRHAGVYVDLFDLVLRARDDARIPATAPDDDPARPAPVTEDEWRAIRPRLAAFCTDNIRTLVHDLTGELARYETAKSAVREAEQLVQENPTNADLIQSRDACLKESAARSDDLVALSEEIDTAIRKELGASDR